MVGIGDLGVKETGPAEASPVCRWPAAHGLRSLALSPVSARLADLLLTLERQDTGEVVGYSHAELGEMIGAGRQSVTETLGKMKAEELVATGHKRVRIIQKDRLRRVAEEM